jgi:hypothetical protein
MTEDQKDVIVKAAQALEEAWRPIPKYPDRPLTALETVLVAAVRAAEQRWAHSSMGRHAFLYRDGQIALQVDVWMVDLLPRIARLLNEDDAKGGGK